MKNQPDEILNKSDIQNEVDKKSDIE